MYVLRKILRNILVTQPHRPSEAAEVFSLMRDSNLEPDAYVDRFFNTGRERQGDYGQSAERRLGVLLPSSDVPR